MSSAGDSHNGMITSLTVCLESDVWSCKDSKKDKQFAAASVIAFLAVNGLQHFITPSLIGPLNTMVAVMPSVLFIGYEFVYCTKRMDVMSQANFDRTKNLVRIVPMLLLPLVVYTCAGNTAFHDLVCGTVHSTQALIPAPQGNSNKYIATVKANALSALHSAQNALNTGMQDYSAGGYSNDYSLNEGYSV
jgi:hypothetical protein